MPNRNRKSRRPARRSRIQFKLLGSTRSQSFSQFITRRSLLTVAGTTNYDSIAYSTLLSDLHASRLIKVSRVIVKFYPVTAGATAVQLQGVDPGTAAVVPLSISHPLSQVNRTMITATYPFTNWTNAGSSATGLVVAVVTNVVTTLYFDIEVHALLSIDTL